MAKILHNLALYGGKGGAGEKMCRNLWVFQLSWRDFVDCMGVELLKFCYLYVGDGRIVIIKIEYFSISFLGLNPFSHYLPYSSITITTIS